MYIFRCSSLYIIIIKYIADKFMANTVFPTKSKEQQEYLLNSSGSYETETIIVQIILP